MENERAIVVGATSGIGRRVAELLADAGYKVGVMGRRAELLGQLSESRPNDFYAKAVDVRDTKAAIEGLSELLAELGGVDLVFISSGWGDLNETLDFDIEKQTIDTNVAGFTCVAGWAFKVFERQNKGHLAAITSVAGLRGSWGAPSYNASKAYQMNYLEALRQKAKHQKSPIVVTDIRPGFVDTDMAKGDGLFWVVPVEKAAKQIFKAMLRKKKIVYISKRWRLIAAFLKIVPNCIYDKMQ